MQVSDLPFNRALGIAVQPDGGIRLALRSDHVNHLGSAHAAVVFAVAEACSGEWAIRHVSPVLPDAVAVTRTGSIHYRKPGEGILAARVVSVSRPVADVVQDVARRGMGRITAEVEVTIADTPTVLASASFEWVILRQRE